MPPSPRFDHVRLAPRLEEPNIAVIEGCELEKDNEEGGFAYILGLAFCCMLGRSVSDCAPLAAPFRCGIGGTEGGDFGPLLVPLKRLLGGVGTFFGRSKGGAVFGAVPGRCGS